MGSSKCVCIYVCTHRYHLQRKERNNKWLLGQCTSKTGLNWNVLMATEHHTMRSSQSSRTHLEAFTKALKKQPCSMLGSVWTDRTTRKITILSTPITGRKCDIKMEITENRTRRTESFYPRTDLSCAELYVFCHTHSRTKTQTCTNQHTVAYQPLRVGMQENQRKSC